MVVPILVREIMQSPVETVSAETPIATVAERLRSGSADAVVVVGDGAPVGIVTKSDVVDRVASGDVAATTAADVMSTPVVTVSESAPIQSGASRLSDNDVAQAPVMEGDRVVGLLRTADLAPYLPDYAMHRPEEPLEAEEAEWEVEVEDEAAPGVSVGDVVTFSKPLTERDLELFAEVSGDKNPLHLDESFAERTRFKRRIVHGALAAGVVSAALSKLPGLVIYLGQDVSYSAPVEVGERVTARCEVLADLGHDRYRLKTEEFDEDGTAVISGEAVVLVDPLPDADAEA
ncbi:MAG: CBS domain-containing protein [Haloplanus sp.]